MLIARHIAAFAIASAAFTTPIYARWAELEEASIATKINHSITVKPDYTAESIREVHTTLLNESGREEAAHSIYTYDANAEKMEIISAQIIKGGVATDVDLKTYSEDKNLVSDTTAFEDRHQLRVTYPNLKVGDSTVIKLKITNLKTRVPEYFGQSWYLAPDLGRIDACNFSIKSAVPLQSYINDPKNLLKVSEKKSSKDSDPIKYEYKLEIKRPTYEKTRQESGIMSHKRVTWFGVSSLKSWDDAIAKEEAKYNSVINQDLPAQFQSIVDKAPKGVSTVDLLNYVTTEVINHIKYMGDMRAVEGYMFPRDLAYIAKTGFGDCKDFSVTTAAILRRLGLTAHVAVVYRHPILDTLKPAPSYHFMNHAFLRVKDAAGKTYWIDPTNKVSMAQNIFLDIADKQVYVLEEQNGQANKAPAQLIQTPKPDPKDDVVESERIYTIKGMDLHIKGSGKLKGRSAATITAAELYHNRKTIEDIAYNMISPNLDPEDRVGITIPTLKSREVKDIDISFEYKVRNGVYKTNVSKALRQSINLNFLTKSHFGQITDAVMWPPYSTLSSKNIIKDALIANPESLNFKEDNQYFSVERKAYHEGKDTVIHDITVHKAATIPAEFFKTDTFKRIRAKLEEDSNVIMVLPK